MSIIYSEIYGREVKPGDYILFIANTGRECGMCSAQLAKISKNNFPECALYNDATLGTQFKSKYMFNFFCYKLEQLDKELLDAYNNNYLSEYLRSKKYYDNTENLYDIFGRELNIGDFVCFTKKNSGLNSLSYGIVIDTKHVFTSKGVKKRERAVFKITNLIDEEIKLFNNAKLEYKKYQHDILVNKKVKQLRTGDVFRYNNNLHIYVGKYVFHAVNALPDTTGLNAFNSNTNGFMKYVDEINNNFVNLFFKIDYTTNRGKKLFEKLKSNTATQNDITDYILKTGLTYYDIIGNPKAFKFNLSEKRAGNYIGHIDFNFSCDVIFKLYLYNRGRDKDIHYFFNLSTLELS